jgi:hypothetical protein
VVSNSSTLLCLCVIKVKVRYLICDITHSGSNITGCQKRAMFPPVDSLNTSLKPRQDRNYPLSQAVIDIDSRQLKHQSVLGGIADKLEIILDRAIATRSQWEELGRLTVPTDLTSSSRFSGRRLLFLGPSQGSSCKLKSCDWLDKTDEASFRRSSLNQVGDDI